jgi:hypothetical protein
MNDEMEKAVIELSKTEPKYILFWMNKEICGPLNQTNRRIVLWLFYRNPYKIVMRVIISLCEQLVTDRSI